MSWDLDEFRDLCNNCGLPETTVYQNALAAKNWRAIKFCEMAISAWNDLFGSHDEISTDDPEWIETTYLSESYTEATLQALHSLADILAQVINIVILRPVLPEDDVSLHRVYGQLQRNNVAPDVTSAIDNFMKSAEYKYTNGFVNTIKHRRLIDVEYRIEGGTEIAYREGLRFKQFQYKGENFPEKWVEEILNGTIPDFMDSISIVGNSINDYLR